jgi:hypothetical protein
MPPPDPGPFSPVFERGELSVPGHLPLLNLVAPEALLLVDESAPFLAALWRAIGAGSWVSPQLLAVASARDPDFLALAEVRCEAELSPKELSALLALAALDPAGRAWSEAMQADPGVRARLVQDMDCGGQLATGWLQGMRRLLQSRGLPGSGSLG